MNPWNLSHPPEMFGRVWDLVGGLIREGRILVSEEVFVEIEKKDDGLKEWLGQYKEFAVPHDDEIQGFVKEILASHTKLVNAVKNRSSADAFVVAVARKGGGTVVTEEARTSSATRPRIPDVCNDYGIGCVKFIDLLRTEGFTDS